MAPPRVRGAGQGAALGTTHHNAAGLPCWAPAYPGIHVCKANPIGKGAMSLPPPPQNKTFGEVSSRFPKHHGLLRVKLLFLIIPAVLRLAARLAYRQMLNSPLCSLI